MQLVKSPNPWLERTVDAFDFDKHDAKVISQQMLELMKLEGGIGLSANQVSFNGQIFVMRPHLLEDKSPLTIINPVIVSVTTEKELMVEGCLSHPGLYLNVSRPKGLVANYLDINAKECTIELYDIDARCFLHEYDHLYGIEFTDRVSKLKLNMAMKKAKKRGIK